MSSTRDGLSNDARSAEILVIDDSTANLKLMEETLITAGYRVRLANEGELALHSAMRQPPALIMLDIRMPGINGYEVCRRLKADERTREVPVIFISILEDERDKVKGFREGAVDYITKPFQPEEVLARIQTHLRLRELTERLEQKVAERTGELENANQLLQQEIAERKRAEEALHRLNRELRAISSCNQVLVRAEDEQTLLADICHIICDEAGYRMAWVGYAESDDMRSVRPVAWGGVEEGYLAEANITWADTKLGRGPTGTAIRTGKTDCIQDFATDPKAAPWRENALQRGYRSSIALPLMDEAKNTFGALTIYSTEPDMFMADEIRLLEELAGDLAFGVTALRIRNARREADRRVALLNFAMDKVRESAFLLDESGRFFYVNEEACRRLDYTRDELLALGVVDIDTDCPAELWPDHWEQIKRCSASIFERRHRAKDGRFFPVEINANFIEYEGQDYGVALVRDITDRKRAEEALRFAGVYNRSLIEASLDPLVTIGADGKITDVNSATEQVTGLSRSRLIGTDFCDFFTDPDRARLGCQKVFREGMVRDYPLELRHHDGHITSVHYNASVYRDEKGDVIGVFAAARDITERKRAEAALTQEKALLRCLIDSAADLIFFKDSACCYRGCNKAAEKFIGLSECEQIGKTDFDFFDRETAEEIQKIDREVLDGGKSHRTQDWISNRDGNMFFLDTLKAPYYGPDGEIVGLVGISRDITERMRAEGELRNLNENLERRVEDRTAELAKKNMELERMNKLFVGRELRMVELKKRIRELEGKV